MNEKKLITGTKFWSNGNKSFFPGTKDHFYETSVVYSISQYYFQLNIERLFKYLFPLLIYITVTLF